MTNASGGEAARQRYHPYGAGRPGDALLPTDYRFTGQRHEGTIGLYDYGARFYDPWLGRFVSADTVVPEPGNPQELNRYSYCSNNPVRYVDPTGHFQLPPIWMRWILQNYQSGRDLANTVWGFFTGSDAPEPVQDFVGRFFATPDVGIASPVTVAAAPAKVVTYADDAVKAATNVDEVRHARSSANVVQSILDKILPSKFDPRSRLGKAFYVAKEGETAVAEVAAHGKEASHVIRYDLDLSKAKVLDLTDPTVARAWGYVDDVSAYGAHQALARSAVEEGYNVIKYTSYRGPGYNYALLNNPLNPFNFVKWLIPQMVSPGP